MDVVLLQACPDHKTCMMWLIDIYYLPPNALEISVHLLPKILWWESKIESSCMQMSDWIWPSRLKYFRSCLKIQWNAFKLAEFESRCRKEFIVSDKQTTVAVVDVRLAHLLWPIARFRLASCTTALRLAHYPAADVLDFRLSNDRTFLSWTWTSQYIAVVRNCRPTSCG